MQLRLKFLLAQPFLPKQTDRLFVSFIKKAAKNAGLFEEMFGTNRSKTFCFSCYLPNPKYIEDKILLSDCCFSVTFSDYSKPDILRLYNGFLRLKDTFYPVAGLNTMMLESISLDRRVKIRTDAVVIKMLSPLIVRKHDVEKNKDTYLAYSDPEFSAILKKNTEHLIKKLGLSFSLDGFSVFPVHCKAVPLRTFSSSTLGNFGLFQLTGSPALLNFLYEAGLGSRRNAGRGKFEICLAGRVPYVEG